MAKPHRSPANKRINDYQPAANHQELLVRHLAASPRVGAEGGKGTAHRIARNSKTAARARANVALMSR